MSSRRGTLIKCARCHSWVFMDDAKLSPDEQINYHQGKLPKDWMRVYCTDLCPDCAKKFSELFVEFLNQV